MSETPAPRGYARASRISRWIVVLLTLACIATLAPAPQGGSKTMSFAADMARRGNWREAKYRWEQITGKEAADPRVLNNLAVAYEALGDPHRAGLYYSRALEFSKGDERIESNLIRYDRFWSRIAEMTEVDVASQEAIAFPEGDPVSLRGKGKTVRVPVYLPVPPRFDTTGYRTLLVAKFLAPEASSVDVPREMVRFIRSKLRKDRELEVLDVTPAPEVPEQTLDDLILNAEFWKYLGREFGADLIVSGVVGYNRKDSSGYEDVDLVDPQTGQKVRRSQFVERERFSYNVEILFFEGSSGRLAYRDRLQRSVMYRGSNNDPLTAFFDLSESLSGDVMAIVEPRTREDVRIIFKK